MRTLACGLFAAVVWQCHLHGAQNEQAALAEYLRQAPDLRLLNASIVVLASSVEKHPDPKNAVVRVERCVKAPNELKGTTLTLKLTDEQAKTFQSLRGKALFFLNIAEGKTYELLDDEAIRPYLYAQFLGVSENLLAYASRIMKETDAIEPGTVAWAKAWSVEPGHLTVKGMLLPKETDLTPAKLYALGALAWLWSRSDVVTMDGEKPVIRKFSEYAALYRQHHKQHTDTFRDALMAAELVRAVPSLTPEQLKKYAALNTDSFLTVPAMPDFDADARTDVPFQPIVNSVNVALLAESPCYSASLEYRKRPIEFFQTCDRKLLGSAPEKLFDSGDKIARSMGISLLMIHSPERLKLRLREKLLTEGYSFASTMDYLGAFLQVKDSEGMAAVLGMENILEGDNLLTILRALINLKLFDTHIAHAVGRLHNLVLRKPKTKRAAELIKLFATYEAALDTALRQEITPNQDGENQIADALAVGAEAQIGPRRDAETAARCDARNREAMGMLWDAKWIRREDKSFDIKQPLEKAEQFITPPAIGNGDFHADGRIEAIEFYSSADKLYLVTGDELGRVAVWDMESGKIVRMLGRTGHRIVLLSVGSKYLLAAHSAGEYTAWDLEAGKELWTTVKKIENPGPWGPPAEHIWDALVFSEGAETRCRILRGDRLLTCDITSGKELSDIPLPPKIHFSRGAIGSMGDCSFARDGKTLAGSSYDGTVRCYSVDGRFDLKWSSTLDAEVHDLDGDPNRRIAVSPFGKRIAIGRIDGTVTIIDIESGREIAQLSKHADQPSVIEFIDEDHVISASQEGDLRISEVTGKEISSSRIPKGQWRLSPNGKELVVARGAAWSVIDVKTGKPRHENGTGSPAPIVLLKLRGNSLIASGGRSMFGNSTLPLESETVIFDIKTGQITKRYPQTTLDVSTDGGTMICVHGNDLSLVDVTSGKSSFTRTVIREPKDDDNWVFGLDAIMNPDGSEFFQTLPAGGVARCNSKNGEQLGQMSAGDPACYFDQLQIDASGKLLLADTVIESLGQGILFNIGSMGKSRGPMSNFHGKSAIAFSPDSKVLVQRGNYAVYLNDSRMPLEFGRGLGPKVFEERGSESIPAVAFSPNGKWFATVDQHSREPWDIDGRATIIRVFETANWTLRTRYVAGPLATAICWKPDNRTAYVGHANGMISELELIPEK